MRFLLGTSRWTCLAACVAVAGLAICAALAAPASSPATNPNADPADSKPALGAVTSFPSAGISIAFPADQQPIVSADASCLAVYVCKDDALPIATLRAARSVAVAWQSITSFYALKLADSENDSTPKETAERLMSLHEKQPQYASSQRRSSQEVEVGGQKGYCIANALTRRDGKEVAVLAVFPGIHQEQELKFTHALLVQVRGQDVPAALATARAILDSVQVAKVQSPVDSGLFFQSGVKVRSDGFTLDVPDGWYVKQCKRASGGPIAFLAAITDYIQKDVLTISVSVAPVDRPPPIDEMYLADMVAGMKASLADDKWTPLGSHLAKLDGQPAAQVMGNGVAAGNPRTVVSRQAFMDNAFYTITLTYPKDQAVRAWEAMEKLCEGFRFSLDAQTTKPAKPRATTPGQP